MRARAGQRSMDVYTEAVTGYRLLQQTLFSKGRKTTTASSHAVISSSSQYKTGVKHRACNPLPFPHRPPPPLPHNLPGRTELLSGTCDLTAKGRQVLGALPALANHCHHARKRCRQEEEEEREGGGGGAEKEGEAERREGGREREREREREIPWFYNITNLDQRSLVQPLVQSLGERNKLIE